MNYALHNTVWLDYDYSYISDQQKTVNASIWPMSLSPARHNAAWLSTPGICSIAWAVAMLLAHIPVPLNSHVALTLQFKWFQAKLVLDCGIVDSNWHLSSVLQRDIMMSFWILYRHQYLALLHSLFCEHEGVKHRIPSKAVKPRSPELLTHRTVDLRSSASRARPPPASPGHLLVLVTTVTSCCCCTSAAHTEARVCSSGEILDIKNRENGIDTSLPYFGVKLSCVCLMFA